MQIDAHCIECLIKRQMTQAQSMEGEETKYLFMRDVMQAILDAPAGAGAPYMVYQFDKIFSKHWHHEDRFKEIKEESNRHMMARLDYMRSQIATADDPLLVGLKFAQTGNYIDFGAMANEVSMSVLDELLEKTPSNPLDMVEYAHFKTDLDKAKTMVYLGDNAGEIVADMAFIEVLKKRYPNLHITFVVRGAPAINDATRIDATAVGLDKLVNIMDNGAAIAGTEWSMLGKELQQVIAEADVILSKGQGNFETFCPSKFPTYYIFLCKCKRFAKMFDVPLLAGMFLSDARMKSINPFC